ncbi:hypothetical protein Mlute_01796 [Meiothermus luteus]|uniref:Uncharacterized protein n=1 Tax=Meiothermus luteus TaxID=2026184 RepID=A0A399ERJ9_9DEIN|nr:hypothetical protein [Meiothermus luteus]RIH84811.1 hypothetical protein Mlute_01796 [Meiothermus luteus]
MQIWGILSGEALAVRHGLTLVSRNTAHLRGLPLRLLNPWEV